MSKPEAPEGEAPAPPTVEQLALQFAARVASCFVEDFVISTNTGVCRIIGLEKLGDSYFPRVSLVLPEHTLRKLCLALHAHELQLAQKKEEAASAVREKLN